jgi:hypothetical protein
MPRIKYETYKQTEASRQLALDHTPILPDTSIPVNTRVEAPIPAEILIPPLIQAPAIAPATPESRLQP